MQDPEYLVIGHLAKAHGTRGEVLIRLLTDEPEAVFEPGRRVILGDDRGGLGETPLEQDRTRAQELAGRYLLVPTEERGELGEGEYFYHQLLGLDVETVDGRQVGRVREVYETEPHHMLEVKGPDGVHLVPFRRELVASVDLEAGRLVIDPPAGLLEL